MFAVLYGLMFGQLDAGVQAKVLQAFGQLDRFEVRFRQETYSDFFDESTAEGVLKLERGRKDNVQGRGRLRMEYQKGERRLIIWDGETCYEKDFLADTESRTPQEEVASDPLVRLLLDGSDPSGAFLIDRRRHQGTDVFRFRPRHDDDLQIEVTFDGNWLPVYMEVLTGDGEGTRFWFENYVLDPTFSADTFSIPPPPETTPPP